MTKTFYVIRSGNKYLVAPRGERPAFSTRWWTRTYYDSKGDAMWFLSLIQRQLGTTAFLHKICKAEVAKMRIVKVCRKHCVNV